MQTGVEHASEAEVSEAEVSDVRARGKEAKMQELERSKDTDARHPPSEAKRVRESEAKELDLFVEDKTAVGSTVGGRRRRWGHRHHWRHRHHNHHWYAMLVVMLVVSCRLACHHVCNVACDESDVGAHMMYAGTTVITITIGKSWRLCIASRHATCRMRYARVRTGTTDIIATTGTGTLMTSSLIGSLPGSPNQVCFCVD